MRHRVPLSLVAGGLLLCACGPSTAPASEGFVRDGDNPILDPRVLVSPTTQTNNVVGVFDPCAVWDERAGLWRVYFTLFDVYAEEIGETAAGIVGVSGPEPDRLGDALTLAVEQQGTFDSSSVETCDIVIVDDPQRPGEVLYYMYYSGSEIGGVENQDFAVYRIALAISEDGERFEPLAAERSRDGVAGVLFGTSEPLGGPEAVGNFITDPTVVVRDDGFHMWTLCVRTEPDVAGGLCYHRSPDGIEWQHLGTARGFGDLLPIQPTVFYNPDTQLFEMYVVIDSPEDEAKIHDFDTNLTLRVAGWYRATSSNGLDWTPSEERVFVEDLDRPWENRGLATGADAIYHDGEVLLFYPSFTTEGGSVLGSVHNWPLNLARARARTREP